MDANQTTAAIQLYLDDLAGVPSDTPVEPIISALLARSAARLHMLCASLLYRNYPRLTRPPYGLQAEEVLGAVVERLLKALREARPRTVRQFFAITNQHIRWEMNELARRLERFPLECIGRFFWDCMHYLRGRSDFLYKQAGTALDEQIPTVEAGEDLVPSPESSASELTPNAHRTLDAIEQLPEDEREVFGMVRIQEMTQAEVAAIVGVSTKTVQRHLHSVLLLLTERLGDLGPTPPAGALGQLGPASPHARDRPNGRLILATALVGAIVGLALQQADRRRRAVQADLTEVAVLQERARWAQARAAIERAEARPGGVWPNDLRRLARARRDFDLVMQLDAIRLNRVTRGELDYYQTQASRSYEEAFQDAGLGRIKDPPSRVAANVSGSAVRWALIATLDDWSVCATDKEQRNWLLEVAQQAAPDPEGWHARILDPASSEP